MSALRTSLAFLSLSALAAGCAAEPDLDDELADAESVTLDDTDGKADGFGLSNYKIAGSGDWFVIIGYDGYGREVTRMYGGTSGATSWATMTGYGASVSLDVTRSSWGKTTVLQGKVAGSQYSIYSDLSTASKYGTRPALTAKQTQLVSAWTWLAPTVMERSKDDAINDCIGAIAEAVIRVTVCALSGGFWDCIGAAGSVIDAISTCADALD